MEASHNDKGGGEEAMAGTGMAMAVAMAMVLAGSGLSLVGRGVGATEDLLQPKVGVSR